MMQGLFGRTSKIETGWDPTKIPGCVGYFRSDFAYQDAEKVIPCTNDTLIYTGENQVVGGAENDLIQVTEAKRFVYKVNQLDGCPAWLADGLDDFMLTNGSLGTLVNGDKKPFSIFLAMQRINSTGGLGGWVATGNPWTFIQYIAVWITKFAHQGNTNTGSFNVPTENMDTNPHSQIWTQDGELSNAWVDSIQKITDQPAYVGPYIGIDQFIIGRHPAAEGTWHFNGYYFEIAIYDNVISEPSRALLNSYVATRYPSII